MPRPKKAPSRDQLLTLCRSLPGATEDVKWGADLAFSVGGKMFAVTGVTDPSSLSFRCEPHIQEALVTRAGIELARYNMHKWGWVTVSEWSALDAEELDGLIRSSHRLVLGGLSKKRQRAILAGSEG